MFAPAIGVPEDIANANSTACLAAHLHAAHPGGGAGIAVDMGDALGAPATITAAVTTSEQAGSAVRVGGTARIGSTVSLRHPG
ncbi:PhzF family phenazine biosynthesis protein [Streptomyces sp. G45]|uniref:PhzF family phenazine biosynthesis protein n=1 Tax=Streptomyces sp. G45 TaxID=3406627 RepID=UPI003C2622CD